MNLGCKACEDLHEFLIFRWGKKKQLEIFHVLEKATSTRKLWGLPKLWLRAPGKTKFCWQNSAEQNSASGKQNPVGKRGWGLNVLLFCLVGNGSADRDLLGYFQKMQSADFQVGKEHRKEICSFFRPSRSRKMGFSCCCPQLQMGQCLLIFYFFLQNHLEIIYQSNFEALWLGFFLFSHFKSCWITTSLIDQGKNIILVFPGSKLNLMHLQEKNNCCCFQMKYGSVVLGIWSACKEKKICCWINCCGDEWPKNDLVLSQELPQICRFFMR